MTQRRQRLKLTRTQRQRFRRLRKLTQLQGLDPIEFELFCGYLYRRGGYRVFTTVAAGDEGVDLYLRKGLQRVVVQCKRYRGTVGQPTVRDLYGTMQHNGANAAVLITTGRFSGAAEQWAADKPIQLVDGHDLVSWTRRLGAPRAGRIPQAGYWRGMALRAGLAALLLLLGAAAFWSWQQGAAANLPPTPTPPPVAWTHPRLSPAVDGRLGDWVGVASRPLRAVLAQGSAGASPVGGGWQTAWRDDFLLGAVAVDDDRYLPGEEAITLYLARPGPDGELTPYRFLLRPGVDEVLDAAGNRPVAGALLATARTNSGYAVEFALPWAALDATAPPPLLRSGLILADVDAPAGDDPALLGSDAGLQTDDPATWPWVALDGVP